MRLAHWQTILRSDIELWTACERTHDVGSATMRSTIYQNDIQLIVPIQSEKTGPERMNYESHTWPNIDGLPTSPRCMP